MIVFDLFGESTAVMGCCGDTAVTAVNYASDALLPVIFLW